MSTAEQVQHVLIGTAGHIDHGKTRLVARLTGIDTDRLPEEKARGISIDLGFAHWEADSPDGERRFQFGIVDVPGHERFVKNMVAGATGVNLALLVVAADDSVMPQTREHLEIMDLLGVRRGVVAITKTDLVEEDFVELVQADIEDLVAGTFLEGCPIVPVSSETGAGIPELQAEIARIAGDIEWTESLDFYRMPVDRVFSLTGHGTVVTGSVLSGGVQAGDVLELLPEQREVRVRSVQIHGAQSGDSGIRRRTALNLAGLKTDEVARGSEIATPSALQPTRRLVVRLRSLSSSPLVLKDRLQLNLHLGTAETPARLVLKGNQLKPGTGGYAELRTKEPVVAQYGQRFILRRISPALTLAGGTVLDPCVEPRKRIRDLSAYAEALHESTAVERLSYILSQADSVDAAPQGIAARVGIRAEEYTRLIEQMTSNGELVTVGRDRKLLVHRDRLKSLETTVMRTVRSVLDRHQPRRSLPRNTFLTACREIAPPQLIEAVFDHLLAGKQLVKVGENVGPADAQVKLTKNQQRARTRIIEEVTAAGLLPPTTKELAATVGQSADEVAKLLNLCVEDALLVRVSDNLYFAPQALESARGICENLFGDTPEATMSELREAWGITRKFSVPLCEYFDSSGVTERRGDVRVAGPRMNEPLYVVGSG